MTRENWIAIAAIVITLIGYGIQDIRRQSAVETKLEALCVWQIEHQKTESLMAVTNQKVDALAHTVEKMATTMDRFLEEVYNLKAERIK